MAVLVRASGNIQAKQKPVKKHVPSTTQQSRALPKTQGSCSPIPPKRPSYRGIHHRLSSLLPYCRPATNSAPSLLSCHRQALRTLYVVARICTSPPAVHRQGTATLLSLPPTHVVRASVLFLPPSAFRSCSAPPFRLLAVTAAQLGFPTHIISTVNVVSCFVRLTRVVFDVARSFHRPYSAC